MAAAAAAEEELRGVPRVPYDPSLFEQSYEIIPLRVIGKQRGGHGRCRCRCMAGHAFMCLIRTHVRLYVV